MTNPFALDVRNQLVSENVIAAAESFVGAAPKNYDPQHVVFIDAGGSANPKWLRDNSRLVINVRGAMNDYPGAWQMAQKIKDALLGRERFIIGTVEYIRFVVTTDILFMGYDQNDRPMFTMVYEVTRDYSNTDTSRLPIN